MKIITNYGQFINENTQNIPNDMFEILDLLKDTSSENILKLRDSLKDLSNNSESLKEGFVGDLIDRLKMKFQKTIDDRIWKYLINKKRDFYVNLIDKMNIFDLTSLDDVFKNYPKFELQALYLAGGMDKAKDTGAGWRIVVEHEFENYPGKETGLEQIDLKEFGHVDPKRVVDGKYVDLFIENPSKAKKMYNLPLILNPVRKEVDRTKDVDFAMAAGRYKSFNQETEPEKYEPTMTDIRTTLSKSIEVGDEHLVRLCDGIFLGLNTAAAAGSYGELQTQSFMNKPILVWMTDTEWSFSDFSLWTFPHITKLARSVEEMKTLVATIMNYTD